MWKYTESVRWKIGKLRNFLLFGIVLFTIFATCNGVPTKAAATPAIITYQGKLLVNGTAATTTLAMKFVIYNNASGGTALYTASGTLPTTSTVNITPVSGLFSVNLGDTGTNSLSPTIFQNNSDLYLEISIDGQVLSPRKRITAAPYSFNSKYLDGVSATSTASTSTYIPISDAQGNFNFNRVTSTGIYANGSLVITRNTTLATTTVSGYLGVGTTNPTTGISAVGESSALGSFGQSMISSFYHGADGYPAVMFAHSRGTKSSPTAVQQGDWIGSVLASGYIGSGTYSVSSFINFEATENFSNSGGSRRGSRIAMYTTQNGLSNPTLARMVIDHSGNIGIGTESPESKLSVYGNILLEGSYNYINFGSTTSTSGYGFRDNLGTIQFKNSDGAWTNISTSSVPAGLDGAIISSVGANWVATRTIYISSSTGYVGFGTVDPLTKLSISGTDTFSAGQSMWYYNDNNSGATIALMRARGTPVSPTAIQNGDNLGQIVAGGYGVDGWTFGAGPVIRFVATEQFTSTSNGSKIMFQTVPNGSDGSYTRMVIDHTGNVGIGSSVTGNPPARLSVYGDALISSIGPGATTYLNFGSGDNVTGTAGYGFRDLNGTMQYKNSGGDWANISSGGSLPSGSDGNILYSVGTSWTVTSALFISSSTGYVGVGTSRPLTRLSLVAVGGYQADSAIAAAYYSGLTPGSGYPAFGLAYARGTESAPSAVQNDDRLGSITAVGYGTSAWGTFLDGSSIDFRATQSFTNTAKGSKISFSTVQNDTSSGVVRMTIDQTGNVGIGISDPPTKLSVSGGMLLHGSNNYLNFNSVTGTDGYGLRDYGGLVQVKHSSDDNWYTISTNTTGVTGVQGSGSSHQIAWWDGSSTITSDNGLNWDPAMWKLGVGTTSVIARLGVENGSVLFNGSSGDTPFSGAGTRLMWIPSKGSFRAGIASSTEWDNVNIGTSSQAIGKNVLASGESSLAFGANAQATARDSIVIGSAVQAAAVQSSVIGVGAGINNPLVNNIADSLMIGFNSDLPTLFVGSSNGAGTTGFVGIATTNTVAALTVSGSISLLDSNSYINFGAITSTGGYGLRDNGGVLEFKNSGGTWSAFGSATTTVAGNDGEVQYNSGGVLSATSSLAFRNGVFIADWNAVVTGTNRGVALIGNSNHIDDGPSSYVHHGTVLIGFANRTVTNGSDAPLVEGRVAIGSLNLVDGYNGAVAIGSGNASSGNTTMAMGSGMTVSGSGSVGIGLDTGSRFSVTQANTMAIMGGNVGIGTTTPISPLYVFSSSTGYTAGTSNATIISRVKTNASDSNTSIVSNFGAYLDNVAASPAAKAAFGAYGDQFDVTLGSLDQNVVIGPFRTTVGNGYDIIIAGGNGVGSGNGGITYIDGGNGVGGGNDGVVALIARTNYGKVGVGTSTPNARLSIIGASTSTLLSVYTSTTQPALFVSSNGYVGVGTSTPQDLLHLWGNNAGISLANTSGTPSHLRLVTDEDGDVYIQVGSAVTSGATTSLHFGPMRNNIGSYLTIAGNGNVGIGTTTPNYALTVSGSVNITGSYLTNGADYAEYFYTKDKDLTSGEVVCVDVTKNNAVKRCTRSADPDIMGVVSTKPSIIGNKSGDRENDPNYKIIGMLGQVAAKVSAENGPVRPGDSLTSASSTPGYLMRADAGDSTVGVALEGLDSGVGTVNVLISRRNKSMTVEQVEEKITRHIADMKIEDEVQILVSSAVGKYDFSSVSQLSALIDSKLQLFGDAFRVKLSDEMTMLFGNQLAVLNSSTEKLMAGFGEFSDSLGIVSTSLAFFQVEELSNNSAIWSAIDNVSTTLANFMAKDSVVSTSTELTIDQRSDYLMVKNNELNLNGAILANVTAVHARSDKWRITEDGLLVSVVQTSEGNKDVYAMQALSSELVFSGSGRLQAGETYIKFDTSTRDMIDSGQSLKVSVTLTSEEAKGIFVKAKDAFGFVVKELMGGQSDATFDWVVVARRGDGQVRDAGTAEPIDDAAIEETVVGNAGTSTPAFDQDSVPTSTVPEITAEPIMPTAEPDVPTAEETSIEPPAAVELPSQEAVVNSSAAQP